MIYSLKLCGSYMRNTQNVVFCAFQLKYCSCLQNTAQPGPKPNPIHANQSQIEQLSKLHSLPRIKTLSIQTQPNLNQPNKEEIN